jgi:pimeloyl-ACP methyl ester carboxylesterase
VKSNTIVFIHGMFMSAYCWEHWIERYAARGYHCLAPAWPGRGQPVEVLRHKHPDPELARLTLSEVVEHLASFIKKLDETPILIGHSMGGLAVQLLLQRVKAAAGVAIDPAPPHGVITTKWSFIKSNWPAVNPFASKKQPVVMTFEQFQYAFVNTLPLAEQQAAYDRYVVPESRRVPAELLTSAAKVDFKSPHPPLLITAGEIDHIIPASLCRSNFNRYQQSGSITAFHEFPGRTHFLIGQTGWEEVADYILNWLNAL